MQSSDNLGSLLEKAIKIYVNMAVPLVFLRIKQWVLTAIS